MHINTPFDEQQELFWASRTNVRSYNHPVVQLFGRQRVQALRLLLRGWKPSSALDVGCGDGFGMYYMRNIVQTIYGCDNSATMLAANPFDRVFLKQANAHALPYKNASFDMVYCWELLHHIGNALPVVQEMARVAKTCVCCCEPNCLNPAMFLFGWFAPGERGLLRFTPGHVSRLFKRAGLKHIAHMTGSWFTPNRTPYQLAKYFAKLPYHFPLMGLYTITVGYKGGAGT